MNRQAGPIPIRITLSFFHFFSRSLGPNNCVIIEESRVQKYHFSSVAREFGNFKNLGVGCGLLTVSRLLAVSLPIELAAMSRSA